MMQMVGPRNAHADMRYAEEQFLNATHQMPTQSNELAPTPALESER